MRAAATSPWRPTAGCSRRPEREVAPFVYAGVAILTPALFADAPRGAFSLNLLFDRAIEAGRLYGLRLEGVWMHVGTPDGDRRRGSRDPRQRGVIDWRKRRRADMHACRRAPAAICYIRWPSARSS